MGKMGLPLRKTEQHFTYRDDRGWPDERWKLIDGIEVTFEKKGTLDC